MFHEDVLQEAGEQLLATSNPISQLAGRVALLNPHYLAPHESREGWMQNVQRWEFCHTDPERTYIIRRVSRNVEVGNQAGEICISASFYEFVGTKTSELTLDKKGSDLICGSVHSHPVLISRDDTFSIRDLASSEDKSLALAMTLITDIEFGLLNESAD